MKHIIKGASPEDFERWKMLYQRTHFDDLPAHLPKEPEEGIFYYSKHQLKEVLLNEQRFVCCYCNNSIINGPNTTIEHLEPREGDTITERIFDYQNLLSSCEGGRKNSTNPKILYCDASKNMDSILLTPLMNECENEIYFNELGEIYGYSSRAIESINCLNLNNPILNNLRAETIGPFIFEYDENGNQTDRILSNEMLENIFHVIEANNSHKFQRAILSTLKTVLKK